MFGANIQSPSRRCNRGFTKYLAEAILTSIRRDTLVTLTPLHPIVTFTLKPDFHGISLQEG